VPLALPSAEPGVEDSQVYLPKPRTKTEGQQNFTPLSNASKGFSPTKESTELQKSMARTESE